MEVDISLEEPVVETSPDFDESPHELPTKQVSCFVLKDAMTVSETFSLLHKNGLKWHALQ